MNIEHSKSYRSLVRSSDLVATRLREDESDLYILTEISCAALARRALSDVRRSLRQYILKHPQFRSSLHPLAAGEGAPAIVREMAAASARCGLGPMAAVAGAVAQFVGESLRKRFREIIVENGGDIYIRGRRKRIVAVYAGDGHALSGRLGIIVRPAGRILGIGTSSRTVGPSLSWGRADAAVVVAQSAILADAAATALANRVLSLEPTDWEQAVASIQKIEGIVGTLIVVGEKMQVWGAIELTDL